MTKQKAFAVISPAGELLKSTIQGTESGSINVFLRQYRESYKIIKWPKYLKAGYTIEPITLIRNN